VKQFFSSHIRYEIKVLTGATASDAILKMVSQDKDLKKTISDFKKSNAKQEAKDLVDFQESINISVPLSKQVALVLSPFLDTDPRTARKNILTHATNSAMITKSRATGSRGADVRNQMLSMLYTWDHDELEQELAGNVTNLGKVNDVGRVDRKDWVTSAIAPLDAIAMDGLVIFIRFCLDKKEEMVDWTDYKSFGKRPLYPKVTRHTEHISRDVHHDNHKDSLNKHKVRCDKNTHQWRQQGQQTMDDKGIHLDQIARFYQYNVATNPNINSNQTKSYLFNTPLGSMVERGVGDHKYPSAHSPAWAKGPTEVLKVMIEAAFPNLLDVQTRLRTAFDEAKNDEERKEKRLFMAVGGMNYFILALERFFMWLSSTPVDLKSKLLDVNANVDAYYLQFQKGFHGSKVMDHPVFVTKAFTDLVFLTRQAQEKEANANLHLCAPMRSKIERSIAERVIHPLKQCVATGISNSQGMLAIQQHNERHNVLLNEK
jgi:hypothetical protein